MCVDHFLLPRLFGISRPLLKIPGWSETSVGNWPAIAALAISVLYGTWATGILPGEDANRYWGPAPLEAWVMAGVLYIAFVAIARAAAPASLSLKRILGFSKVVIDEPLPSYAVVDMATQAEGAAGPEGAPPFVPAQAAGKAT